MKLIELLMNIHQSLVIIFVSGSPLSEPLIIEKNHSSFIWVSYFGQSDDVIAET